MIVFKHPWTFDQISDFFLFKFKQKLSRLMTRNRKTTDTFKFRCGTFRNYKF